MTDRVTLVVREQRKKKKNKSRNEQGRSGERCWLILSYRVWFNGKLCFFVASLVFARKAELEWKKRQAGRRLLAASCWLFLSFHRLLLFLLLLLTWARKRATASSPPYKSNETPFPRGHCTVSRSSLHTPLGFSLRLLRPPPCVRARDFPPLRPPPQRFRQSTVSGSCCCTCTTCGFIKFFFFFFFVFQSFTSLEFVGLATDTNRCHSFGAWRFAASLRFSCCFFFTKFSVHVPTYSTVSSWEPVFIPYVQFDLCCWRGRREVFWAE